MLLNRVDIDAAVTQVRMRGYTIIENAVPHKLAATLRAALENLQVEDRLRWGEQYLFDVGQEGFVINIGDRGTSFEELLMLRPMMPVVESLLGSDIALYLYQGVVVPPGGGFGAYPWKWHCDLYHVSLDVHDPNFIVGVNCLIYLDDVTSENGGTFILPGTQGLLEKDVPIGDMAFLKERAVQVEAPAGSAVIFNPLMWHCAGANSTNRARWAIKMLCVHDWVLPQMDYARSVQEEVLARLDDGGRRLLGCANKVKRTFDEG